MNTTSLFTSWMHLGDEALAGTALQHQHGDETLLSPAAQAHLAECPRCLARLDDLRLRLDATRQQAAAIADARFPQAILDQQRAGILARLAARHANARVLMFPTATIAHPRPVYSRLRTVAATLAAGFFVSLLTGQALYLHDRLVRSVASQAQADRDRLPHIPRHHVRWTAESGPDAQPGDATDDRLLGEIESELARGRRNPALRALDDLTPHASNDPKSHRYRER